MSRTSNRYAGFSCGNPACPTGTRCPLHGGTMLTYPRNSADCCMCKRDGGRCFWHGGGSVRDFILRPSGCKPMDGLTLDAVEGGGIMIRPNGTTRVIILSRREVMALYRLEDETLIRNIISAYATERVR